MTNQDDEILLLKIRSAWKSSSALAEFLSSNRMSAALFKPCEDEYERVFVLGYKVLCERGDEAESNAVLKDLRKRPGHIATETPIATILRDIIVYDGEKDASRLTRDKAVMQLLALDEVPFDKAGQYIQKRGGFQACYLTYRQRRRGASSSADESTAERANRSLRVLLTGPLKSEADGALAYVERTARGPAIRHAVRVPKLNTQNEENEFWDLIDEAVAKYSDRRNSEEFSEQAASSEGVLAHSQTAVTVDPSVTARLVAPTASSKSARMKGANHVQ